MDPMTILLGAKGAFEAIKVGVQYGKELHGMIGDVSRLFGAVSDLTKMAAEPPKGWFNKQSAEQIALDAFMAKKEAEQMQEQVKNLIFQQYGMNGWDEIQREIIRVRKEQKAAALQAQKEQEEFLHNLIVWGLAGVTIIVIVGLAFTFLVILAR